MSTREARVRKVEIAMDTSNGFLGIVVGWPPGCLDNLIRRLDRALWERYKTRVRLHMRELPPEWKGRVVRAFVELVGPRLGQNIRIWCVHVKEENALRRTVHEFIRWSLHRWAISAIFVDEELRKSLPPLLPDELIRRRQPMVLADIVAWLNLAYKRGYPLTRFRTVEDFIRNALVETIR